MSAVIELIHDRYLCSLGWVGGNPWRSPVHIGNLDMWEAASPGASVWKDQMSVGLVVTSVADTLMNVRE